MPQPLPVNNFTDSKAALLIYANPVFHDRTKHFETYLFFVGEKVVAGVIKVLKIHTNDQPADMIICCAAN